MTDLISTHADAPMDVVAGEKDVSYVKVERLQEAGINVADVVKLKQAGYGTAQAIVGTAFHSCCIQSVGKTLTCSCSKIIWSVFLPS